MNVIIIDDEKRARNVLRVLLEEHCPEITTIYEAEDLRSGVALIKEHHPEIVFLDIEMPQHSGLEIVNFIDKDAFQFEIIFTTAYSEYAIKAFQLAAIDYILKPVRPSQVKTAVARAIQFIGKSNINQKLEELKNEMKSEGFKKIALPVADGIRFEQIEDIVVLEADGMYTNIAMRDGETIVISKPLKHFVNLLQDLPFFYKPHRSYLINIRFIKQYIKSDGGYVRMENGQSVSISKDNRDDFLALMQNQ
ncbi:DNA-binding response regulator [Dokdonia sinensis]|uniref:DNA-binding response regulator n=1 Tax=Dokdonia sinensis TaxID=2479847 RepID=A0A3M0G1E9_9FLAO|nr:response regulator transcription factor [Dokdonia sinensis]RMB58595.1 DNA-binding response regulator [Dokdonia sinensis]